MKKVKYYLALLLSAALLYTSCEEDTTTEIEKSIYAKSEWVTKILEFKPAPGQHRNKTPDQSLLDEAKNIIGDNSKTIALGLFGGYVTFAYDGALRNDEGDDLAVFGNAFENSSEPAIMQVSYDENKDGIANDTWYELKGSEYDKSETIKNYQITYFKPANDDQKHQINWLDHKGETGIIEFKSIKPFHPQAMYPLQYGTSVTFTGTLLKNNIVLEDDPTYGKIYKWKAYAWGYADNKGYELKNGFKGADLFDFDNAIDQNGKKVSLKEIHFIKLYNATLPSKEYGITILGDRSADISKIKYLHFNK